MEAQDVAVAVLSAGNLYAGAGSRSAGDRKCDVRQPCRRRLARSRAGRLGAVEPAVGGDCRDSLFVHAAAKAQGWWIALIYVPLISLSERRREADSRLAGLHRRTDGDLAETVGAFR